MRKLNNNGSVLIRWLSNALTEPFCRYARRKRLRQRSARCLSSTRRAAAAGINALTNDARPAFIFSYNAQRHFCLLFRFFSACLACSAWHACLYMRAFACCICAFHAAVRHFHACICISAAASTQHVCILFSVPVCILSHCNTQNMAPSLPTYLPLLF